MIDGLPAERQGGCWEGTVRAVGARRGGVGRSLPQRDRPGGVRWTRSAGSRLAGL